MKQLHHGIRSADRTRERLGTLAPTADFTIGDFLELMPSSIAEVPMAVASTAVASTEGTADRTINGGTGAKNTSRLISPRIFVLFCGCQRETTSVFGPELMKLGQAKEQFEEANPLADHFTSRNV